MSSFPASQGAGSLGSGKERGGRGHIKLAVPLCWGRSAKCRAQWGAQGQICGDTRSPSGDHLPESSPSHGHHSRHCSLTITLPARVAIPSVFVHIAPRLWDAPWPDPQGSVPSHLCHGFLSTFCLHHHLPVHSIDFAGMHSWPSITLFTSTKP